MFFPLSFISSRTLFIFVACSSNPEKLKTKSGHKVWWHRNLASICK